MPTTIDRTAHAALVDDDGSGLTGSVWNKAAIAAVNLDPVDALLANNIQFGGHIKERDRAVAMGEWTSVAFNAANFTGGGTITWTLTALDQVTLAYSLVGKTIKVNIDIEATTVAGTGSELRIAIPGGFTAARRTWGRVTRLLDNGVVATGYFLVNGGGSTISIFRDDGAYFAAATNNTYVYGTFEFEVA